MPERTGAFLRARRVAAVHPVDGALATARWILGGRGHSRVACSIAMMIRKGPDKDTYLVRPEVSEFTG
jgi:hypothetical protein